MTPNSSHLYFFLAENGHTIAPINPWKFHWDWSSHLWVYKGVATGFVIFLATPQGPTNYAPVRAWLLLICPIEKVKRLLLEILSFLKRSQQHHNALLFLTRSAQLPHLMWVSCSDLFAPWTTTTKCRERGRNMHQEPLTFFYWNNK